MNAVAREFLESYAGKDEQERALKELLKLASQRDALIVRAAASAGCVRLLTEDLNHGQVIDGVRVENPFLEV